MGISKIDRTGEEGVNKFGSKMIITKYNNAHDIDVYFPEYDYTIHHVDYGNFKKGKIKCVYEPRCYGKGCLEKENIKCQKMVKKQMNISYGIICYGDVTILNSKKKNLHIKGV